MIASSTTLASRPVQEGLITLFTARRQEIDGQCSRFISEGDAEALHDLRVAMRRLHSLFVAFAPALEPTSPLPKQLRQLQKQTNHARDLEVSLELLRNSKAALGWLDQEWQQQLDGEYERLRLLLPAGWPELSPILDMPERLLNVNNTGGEPLGSFTAKLLAGTVSRLSTQRKKVCRNWHDKPAHKLRVTGKQIRYLLEPFSEENVKASKAVKKLKRFQDLLGDYHDRSVLIGKLDHSSSAASPTQLKQLKRAVKQLKREAKSLKQQYCKDYCGKRAKRLRKQLKRAQKSLVKS